MSSDSSRSTEPVSTLTSASPLQLSRRDIRPLPSRPKSSGGPPGRSQNFVNSDSLSPTSSPPTDRNSASHRRHSYHFPGVGTDARHLSPPLADPPFQFGQIHTKSPSNEQHDVFTFRSLHNVTPRPSPEPEESPHLSLQAPLSPPGDRSSSPFISLPPPEDEYPQPLHTLPSEEKIAVTGADDLPALAYPHHTELPAEALANPRLVSPSQSVPSLSFTQPSDLSPTPELDSRRISDVSIVSDRSKTLIPYDVRDERAPSEPFFTPAFQTALQKGLGIARSAATALCPFESSSEPGGDLNRLLKDAKELGAFHSSDTRTIAVLGDSGEGKSSLINSLLHVPEIAKTGDIGSACTSVVTEYRQKTKHQNAPFTIEVEYLSNTEIEELIKELVWNYRKIFLPETEQNTVSAEDYTRYQRESEQAWSALEAAFKHQRMFKREFLSDMSEGALERVKGQLIQWVQDIKWPEGGVSGIWKSTGDTAEECCEKTSIFMQDRLWPFTKIIRVYLNAQVLKTGVVLADLPGLHDTNLARVRATQTYLLKCDHVFIVAKISRAITDQSLKSSIYTVLARHVPLEWEESAGKNLNLAVICTKSEEINQGTARREFCGPNKRIARSVIEQLDKDIEHAKATENRPLKKELKRKQDLLLIDARNNHVKEGLQKAYASKVPGGMLDVFCVSNTMYEKFSRKGNAEMVSASGVPEVRRFCHSITASAQLLEAKHFLQSKLSSLLDSIELWANSFPDSGRVVDDVLNDSVFEALQDTDTKIFQSFNEARVDLNSSFRELVMEFLDKRNDNWEQAAIAKGSEWVSWHHTQYKSWCMHDGENETPKRAYMNWNAEFLWKMRMELAFQWDMLEDEVQAVFDKLLGTVRWELLHMKALFSRKSGKILQDVEHVTNALGNDIEYKFSLARQAFARDVKLIRRKASEGVGNSYILAEMLPAYRSASEEKGRFYRVILPSNYPLQSPDLIMAVIATVLTSLVFPMKLGPGYNKRQVKLVQGRIANGMVFPNISIKLSSDMNNLVMKTFKSLIKSMEEVLNLMRNDVDMALIPGRQSNGNGDEERDEEENELKMGLGDVVKGLKARHAEVLEVLGGF